MLTSNKLKYIVFTLAMVGLFALFHFNQESTIQDVACTGTLKKNAFLLDDSEAVLDTSMYLLLRKGHEGIVNYNGAVTHKGKRYKVNRMISFNYSHGKGSSIYRFIWRDMHVTGEDTLPPELGFIIHSTEEKSYFRMRKLEGNIMTLNKNGSPLFACVIK